MLVSTKNKVIFKSDKQKSGINSSPSLIDELIKAISVLDLDKICELIPEDSEFEGYENKYGFLNEWKLRFEKIEMEQPYLNFPLLPVEGSCQHCVLNEFTENTRKVICFVENDSKYNKPLNVTFELDKNNNLVELYLCYWAAHAILPIHIDDSDIESSEYGVPEFGMPSSEPIPVTMSSF